MRLNHLVTAAVTLHTLYVAFALDCPGQLLVNGGFEEPNTMLVRSDHIDQYSNKYWGWYLKIPGTQSVAVGVTSSWESSSDQVDNGLYGLAGWYTTRPDGLPCARTDWQNK